MREYTISRIVAYFKKIFQEQQSEDDIEPDNKISYKPESDTKRADAKLANNYFFSTKGISFLKSAEQFVAIPCDAQTGNAIASWAIGATIGYGHVISRNEWSSYIKGISQTHALSLFITDINPHVNTIKSKVTVSITQHEFDAMVILAFNIGTEEFNSSPLLKIINDPTVTTAYISLEAAWKVWNKSQGIINSGLINRRQAEWNIYSKGVYLKW